MEKQIQDLKACLDAHITESGYYRRDISEKLKSDSDQLSRLEEKVDQLIEIYKGATMMRQFVFGVIGIIGSVTAIIWGWINILGKKD
jgi:hypothetical protein